MFKVGDIVTGKKNNGYLHTNEKGTYEVVNLINNRFIKVKILTQSDRPDKIGKECTVKNDKFILFNSSINTSIKCPDIFIPDTTGDFISDLNKETNYIEHILDTIYNPINKRVV